jgi:hypothetical protein
MNQRTDFIFSTVLYIALFVMLTVLGRISWLVALPLSMAGFVLHAYFLSMFGDDDIYEEHQSSLGSAVGDHLFASAPAIFVFGLIAFFAHGA